MDDADDTRRYIIVINEEDQYSIWLTDHDMPRGWRAEGTEGTRTECLERIGQVWTDMRPRSVREYLAGQGSVP